MPIKAKGGKDTDNGEKYPRKIWSKTNAKHNTIVGSFGAIFMAIVVVIVFAGIFDKNIDFSPTGGLKINSSSEAAVTPNSIFKESELLELIRNNALSIRDNTEALQAYQTLEDQRHLYLDKEIKLKFDHIKESLKEIKDKLNKSD